MKQIKSLRVLSISTDRDIFREGSEAEGRMKDIGSIVDEFHIVIFSKIFDGLKKKQIATNVWIYPTNSLSRWLYVFDACALAKKLFFMPSKDFSITDPLINIITAQDPFECGLAGYFISKKLGIPLHLQIHTDFLNEYFRKLSLLNRIRVIIAKFLLSGKVSVRAVSEKIKESIFKKLSFGKKFPPAVTVLPVFVDVAKFKNAPETRFLSEKYPGNNLLVLMASRLEKEKNIELAFRLIARARAKLPETHIALILAGSGSEEQHLRSLAKRLHISDCVFFEGNVSNIALYYKAADVLLVTSHYEGYGRMFLEAAAAGCPVITFNVGAAVEVLEQSNGMICEEMDHLCLLRNLILFADNSLIRDQLKNSARTAALRIVPKTKEEYLSEYKTMLEKAANSGDFFSTYS